MPDSLFFISSFYTNHKLQKGSLVWEFVIDSLEHIAEHK